MLPRRYTRSENSAFTDSERHLILAAETLRAGDTSSKSDKPEKAEEKISIFWRVFGGTLLSISALAVLNAYQSLANNIHDVRSDVGRLRENSGDFIKKDEFNNRTNTLWTSLRDAQAINASVSVLSNKQASLETQLAAAEQERREFCRELLQLRERLAKLEGQHEAKPAIKSKTEGVKPGD